MTTPSQAPLTLPPSFASSFWPSRPSFPSYRAAVSHLYSLLQSGIDEDTALLALVDEIVQSHWNYVDELKEKTNVAQGQAAGRIAGKVKANKPLFKGARPTSSSSSSSTSSLVGALHAATIDPLATSHVRTANALTRTILEPFGQWSQRHAEKVAASWKEVEEWLDALEQGQDELDRLKSTYEAKCRQADEAEDDARFSGLDVGSLDDEQQLPAVPALDAAFVEKTTPLPPPPSADTETNTAAEGADGAAAGDEEKFDPVKLERRQTLRKQFGFSPRVPSGGRPSSETLVASPDGQQQPVRRPSLSPTSSSRTTATNLSSALAPALQGIKSRIASAAGAGGIGERYKRLRREADRYEADYLAKARKLDTLRCRLEDALAEELTIVQRCEVERLSAVKTMLGAYSAAMGGLHPSLAARTNALVKAHGDPAALVGRLVASARTGFYRPLVEVFVPFYHDEPSMYASGWAGFGANLNARWRHELLSASSSNVDGDASTSASSATSASLPLVFSHLLASLTRSYADTALWPTSSASDAHLEQRKTWIYDVPLSKSHACRQAIIDHVLDSAHPGAELGAGLPQVLDRFDPPTRASTLKLWLAELQECVMGEENWHLVTSLYKAAESVEVKWREEQRAKKEGKRSADGSAEGSVAAGDTAAAAAAGSKTDASTPATQELTPLDDEIRATITQGVISDLGVVLSKLSTLHLLILDSLISHLRTLITSTPTPDIESDGVYTNKLALSLGRYLLRPANVSTSTLASKAPTLLVMDLVGHYDELLPKALERKNKKEEEAAVLKRRTPLRKRTKPVDQRIRRSQLGGEGGTGMERWQLNDGEVPPVPSKLDTSAAAAAAAAATQGGVELTDEPEAATPIAERVLTSSSSSSTTTAPASTGTSTAASTLAPPSSDAADDGGSTSASSAPGSSYGTPKEEVTRTLSPAGASAALPSTTTSEKPSAAAAAKSSASSSSSRPSSPIKVSGEDGPSASGMPLSNVARLSRQFNSSTGSGLGSAAGSGLSRSGSNTSVRGPRPVSTIGGPRALPGGGAGAKK